MAKEEDVMSLLVEQYKEAGNRLVQDHLQQRRGQQDRMEKELGRKKEELLNIYTDAQEFVRDTKTGAAKNPVSEFEKQWTKNNEQIRSLIEKNKQGGS